MFGMPDTTSASTTPEHRRAEFLRGVRLGFPIFLGYLPIGMAFGILAKTMGFSVATACLCSALVLSGSGQLIALSFMASGAGLPATLLATGVVNLRYVLFSSSLSTITANMPLPKLLSIGMFVTDESFAVDMADGASRRANADSMLGVGVISWVGWLLGTLVGSAAAGYIGDPAKWGLDFAMTAMFSALFVALAEDIRHIVIGVAAGLLVAALPLVETVVPLLGRNWHVIIASLAATTLAAVIWRED